MGWWIQQRQREQSQLRQMEAAARLQTQEGAKMEAAKRLFEGSLAENAGVPKQFAYSPEARQLYWETLQGDIRRGREDPEEKSLRRRKSEAEIEEMLAGAAFKRAGGAEGITAERNAKLMAEMRKREQNQPGAPSGPLTRQDMMMRAGGLGGATLGAVGGFRAAKTAGASTLKALLKGGGKGLTRGLGGAALGALLETNIDPETAFLPGLRKGGQSFEEYGLELPEKTKKLTGRTLEELKGRGTVESLLEDFLPFLRGSKSSPSLRPRPARPTAAGREQDVNELIRRMDPEDLLRSIQQLQRR